MLLRSFVLDKAHLYAMISGALGRVCYQPDTTKYEDFEIFYIRKQVENMASVRDVKPQALNQPSKIP